MSAITEFSSGVTAVATSGDTAVRVLSSSGIPCRRAVIHNGAVAGFYCLGGSNGPWHYIRADQSVNIELATYYPFDIHVKRIASGTDMADVFASLFA